MLFIYYKVDFDIMTLNRTFVTCSNNQEVNKEDATKEDVTYSNNHGKKGEDSTMKTQMMMKNSDIEEWKMEEEKVTEIPSNVEDNEVDGW